MIDYTPGKPDFNILRLGHIEYLVSDLARARDFYVDVVGLFETESDADHVYLRAIEDREHHSVVLTRSPSPGIGHFSFRVSCAEDLDRLAHVLPAWACPCAGWRPARNAARAARCACRIRSASRSSTTRTWNRRPGCCSNTICTATAAPPGSIT